MILIDNIEKKDLEKMSIADLLAIGKSLDRNGLWTESEIISELGAEAMSKESIIESVCRVLEI